MGVRNEEVDNQMGANFHNDVITVQRVFPRGMPFTKSDCTKDFRAHSRNLVPTKTASPPSPQYTIVTF